jgi:hypothetical protein
MEKRAAQVKGPQGLEDRRSALFADYPLSLIVEEQYERDKGPFDFPNRQGALFAHFVVLYFQSNSVC